MINTYSALTLISLIVSIVMLVFWIVITTLYFKWIVRSELEKFLEKHPELLRRY